jgi:hypothetical protein
MGCSSLCPPAASIEVVHRRSRFIKAFGKQPGILLSDIDPVYLNAFLPEWIAAAPLDGRHHYGDSEIWHYGSSEALALVKHGLKQKYPVYALFISPKEMAETKARLPQLDQYEWAVAETSRSDAVILELMPRNK